MRIHSYIGMLAIMLSSPLAHHVQAASPKPPRSHAITIDDFFDIGQMQNVAISPDGKHAVWLESRWDKALDKAQSDLWLINTQDKQTQRLTFSHENESSPAWSHDSRFIYFLSSQQKEEAKAPFNGKNQVFRIALNNFAIQPITAEDLGVNAFQLSADSKSLYFLGNKQSVDTDIWADMRASHATPQYAHGKRDTNPLKVLSLSSFKQRTLIDDDKVVWEFNVNGSGSKIARITTSDNELIFLEGWSDIEVYDVKTASNTVLDDQLWRQNAPSPYGWLLGLDWHQDNQQLAFRIDFDGYPGKLFIANTQLSTPILEVKPVGKTTFQGGDIQWRPKSNEICYLGAQVARTKLLCSQINKGTVGNTRNVLAGDTVVGSYSFNASGKQVAFSHNGLNHFHDLFIADADHRRSQFKRLSNINPQVDSWQLPQISLVSWQAPDGTTVEGILELPYGYKAGNGKLPLVVQIHGGPTSATPYSLQHRSYGRTTFAANGWALLSPNYRGSTGYGDKFLTDLIGNEHQIEVADIMAGVDKLIADGIIDGDKMAVMGWSNGGYLTNALISTTDRFKAASSGAGVFDQRLQWMLEDTPGHVLNFMQGLPWEQPQAYDKASSLTYANKITTPTLIHIGEKDHRVPVGHAQGLYRSLKHYLNVPVELIVYPGEGHGLSHYQHRKAKMEWDKKWFEHYVLKQEPI
ncbi:prolyl oligopeptidase family serine peptidase [Shewanella sp. ULN5]|uniref:S9 family peptidase n=1 Tax=Shewanella sp. ULN5 TaxID=2994678 RepID=UPI003531C832